MQRFENVLLIQMCVFFCWKRAWKKAWKMLEKRIIFRLKIFTYLSQPSFPQPLHSLSNPLNSDIRCLMNQIRQTEYFQRFAIVRNRVFSETCVCYEGRGKIRLPLNVYLISCAWTPAWTSHWKFPMKATIVLKFRAIESQVHNFRLDLKIAFLVVLFLKCIFQVNFRSFQTFISNCIYSKRTHR